MPASETSRPQKENFMTDKRLQWVSSMKGFAFSSSTLKNGLVQLGCLELQKLYCEPLCCLTIAPRSICFTHGHSSVLRKYVAGGVSGASWGGICVASTSTCRAPAPASWVSNHSTRTCCGVFSQGAAASPDHKPDCFKGKWYACRAKSRQNSTSLGPRQSRDRKAD